MTPKGPTAPVIHQVHTLSAAAPFRHRSELDQIMAWWNVSDRGVCALVGIGGSGKTALVERFLDLLRGNVLAGAAAAGGGIRKEADALVFSFHDSRADDATFWHEVESWLGEKRSRLFEAIRRRHPLLLIVDGFDAAQELWGGDRFGQPRDPALRDLLGRCADGILPGVSVLLASRFTPLYLRHRHFYQDVSCDRLAAGEAIELLRQSGAAGSREHLARLAAEHAGHALTLKRAARYLATLLGLEPAAPPGSPDVEAWGEGVVQIYRELLEAHDRAALDLWRRVGLFPLSARRQSGAARLEGVTMARFPGDGAELRQLERMRLLVEGEPLPVLHPAVCEPYRRNDGKEAVDHCRDLERALGEHLDEPHPQDARVLDLLEELVYQTCAAGQPAAAWNLYWHHIGGYSNLGWRLGDYERGERICRVFAGGSLATHLEGCSLGPAGDAALRNEWGLYLMALGSLEYAETCFRQALAGPISAEQEQTVRQNLAELLLQAGRLLGAQRACEEALAVGERTGDDDPPALAELAAYIRTLWVEMVTAAADPEPATEGAANLAGFAGYYRALHLIRRGARDAAGDLARANEELCAASWGATNRWSPACRLIRAELAADAGDSEQALALADSAQSWAAARGACELLCRVQWVRARAFLAAAADSGAASAPAKKEALAKAAEAVQAGLSMAEDSGFALHHADLQNLAARITAAAAADPAPAPEPAASGGRDLVFFSYAHKDGTRDLDDLHVMLAPMRQEGLKIFVDEGIPTGARWKEEILQALAATKVAVFFVGLHFLNSDFIANTELPLLLAAAEAGDLTVIWLCVGECNWEKSRLYDYQAAHDAKKPLDHMSPTARKKVLKLVSQQIEAAWKKCR